MIADLSAHDPSIAYLFVDPYFIIADLWSHDQIIGDFIFQAFLPWSLYKKECFPHVQHQTIYPATSTLLSLKIIQSQLQSFSNPDTRSYKSFNMTTSSPSLALQGALERIKNPPAVFNKKNEPVHTKYEHHVGTWACTKLKEVFSHGDWAITSEQTDPNTKKKPDFTVEKAIQAAPLQSIHGPTVILKLHLAMELKKEGQRIEDALVQLCESLEETIDTKGNTHDGEFQVFAVVQSGLDIGFFEFHMDQTILDEENIPHFRGCVSLTEDYIINRVSLVPMPHKPNDLQNLFFNHHNLKKNTPIRSDAKKYTTPCIFNLEKHQQEVHYLFQYMEKNEPRSSW